jgi:hypothetical protein
LATVPGCFILRFKSFILSTRAFHPAAVRGLPDVTELIAVFHTAYQVDNTIRVQKNIRAEYSGFLRAFITMVFVLLYIKNY